MSINYKFIVFIILLLILGLLIGLLNTFYSYKYLYNLITGKDFPINPKVKVNPDKEYLIDIWYYPFYRTIPEKQGKEMEFIQKVLDRIIEYYPYVRFQTREIDFLNGKENLENALNCGTPPDIFFNFSNDSLLSKKWQVPVEAYISNYEKKGFYTVDWSNINGKNHLWGWPFLTVQEKWLSNYKYTNRINNSRDIFNFLKGNSKGNILINYYDSSLLRSLLYLEGIYDFHIRDEKVESEIAEALRGIFIDLDKLRKDGIISEKHDSMIKSFLFNNAIIGPVNPWLERRILDLSKKEIKWFNPGNLIKVYSLNIFRQKNYKGDDHVKVVMEVARLMTEIFALDIANNLGISPAYKIEEDINIEIKYKKLPELEPEERDYFEDNIFSLWIDFWEKDLKVDNIINKMKKN
jgi:hypothetical protein